MISQVGQSGSGTDMWATRGSAFSADAAPASAPALSGSMLRPMIAILREQWHDQLDQLEELQDVHLTTRRTQQQRREATSAVIGLASMCSALRRQGSTLEAMFAVEVNS